MQTVPNDGGRRTNQIVLIKSIKYSVTSKVSIQNDTKKSIIHIQ